MIIFQTMKLIVCLIGICIAASPVWAKDDERSPSSILARLQYELDLQPDQINTITPIIEKYAVAFQDLQTSINDGSINPTSIPTQWQGLEDQETQEISGCLKPYQLTEWRRLQSQIYKPDDPHYANSANSDDEYTNLPRYNGGE